MKKSQFKFEEYASGYKVYTVDTHKYLGEVYRFERSYNLRRYFIIRGWRAVLPNNEKLYNGDSGITGTTRQAAAEALFKKQSAFSCDKCGNTQWTHGQNRHNAPIHYCASCNIPMPAPI
jgi:hypothetical protein